MAHKRKIDLSQDYRNMIIGTMPSQSYVQVFWATADNVRLKMDLRITDSPEKVEDGHFLYWGHHFWFQNGDGGYMGLQVVGPRKKAIFSIWLAIEGSPGPQNRFVREHGKRVYRCLIDYPWKLGQKYRLTVKEGKRKTDGTCWIGEVHDNENHEITTIGVILVPTSWGRLKASYSNTFIEYGYRGCDVPYTRAVFSDLRSRNVVGDSSPRLLKAVYNDKVTPCRNSNVKPLDDTKYTLEAGGKIKRTTDDETVFYRKN